MRIDKIIEDKITHTNDIAHKVHLTKMYGSILWSNNIGKYSANEVELEIINALEAGFKFSSEIRKKKVLFVLSIGYLSGGHTRLMENLASMLSCECDLVITGHVDAALLQKLKKYFSNIFQSHTYDNININDIYSLASLCATYDNVVLNIHPDDIVSVVAAGLAKRKNKSFIHFVNHADHAFSFGSTVADIWHQISQFGAEIDKLRNLHGRCSFLGIPIANPLRANATSVAIDPRKVNSIITAGSANKYKPIKNKSFAKKVPLLLKQFPNAKITVIGVNLKFNYWWWVAYARNFTRLKFHNALNHSDYLSLIQSADIYLDSYPVPGGTAFVEQYLLGKMCAGYRSPQQGYTPLEKVKNDIDSDCIEIKAYNDLDDKIREIHSYENVKHRFCLAINNREVTTINWNDYYHWTGDITIFEKKKITKLPDHILSDVIRDPSLTSQLLFAHKFTLLKAVIIFCIKKLSSVVR